MVMLKELDGKNPSTYEVIEIGAFEHVDWIYI